MLLVEKMNAFFKNVIPAKPVPAQAGSTFKNVIPVFQNVIARSAATRQSHTK
jgi:hypothetical protein